MDHLEPTLTVLQQCIDRRFNEIRLKNRLFDDDTTSVVIAEFMLSMKYDVRHYLLCTDEQLRELWEMLRKNERVIEFLLSLKSEFIARIGRSSAILCAETLSDALSKQSYDDTIIDEDTHQRLPHPAWLHQALKNNDWLLVVFLLDMLPVTSSIRILSDAQFIEEES